MTQETTTKIDSAIESIVPYKNKYALIAYYLGVAAMIPFIGVPFGIVSFVYAKKGFAYVKENPEAKGTDHCRIGIGLTVVGFILTGLFAWLLSLLG